LQIGDNILFPPIFIFYFFIVKKCYDVGEKTSVTNKQLVPSIGTYLCSMQGNACGAWRLRGIFPLRVKGIKLQRIYEKHCLASDENCWGKRLITRKHESTIGSTMQAG
jgi:hypothetical protein